MNDFGGGGVSDVGWRRKEHTGGKRLGGTRLGANAGQRVRDSVFSLSKIWHSCHL